MSTSIDIEAVEYIYRERGIEPAFIEKGWYAVKVLKALSEFTHEGITPIFTGGTSLSKGHGLLQRFSERENPEEKIRKRKSGHSTYK